MEPRISIITLGVSDLQRAVDFYQDGLELPRYEWDGDIAFFETSATWLALFPRDALAEDAGVPPRGSGFSGVTLAHIVRSRDAVDALMEQAMAAGARCVKPPEEKSWGGYSGYFADPDEYLWEIAWNPYFPLVEN
ncbi:VOC family protein [Longibacter sp.]|uniref:VOC family protein n=1 Tax=Longibacter sp. TaxID=2045415 RepID=UPI003EBC8B5E